ncbi:MAG: tyrosine-type recombinase/integrase [Methylotenera sp.]
MANITVRELIAAKAKDKPYKLTVDRGLYVRVAVSGKKRWVVKYVVDGKQKEARLPNPFGNEGDGYMSMADAIAENARIQSLARSGVDYQVQAIEAQDEKKRVELQKKQNDLTVQDLFDTWIQDGVSRADNNVYLTQSFNRHALPNIGAIKLAALSESDLLKIYRKIVENGKYATALEQSKDIKQMLSWAEKRKPWRALMVDGNPADLVNIRNVLPKNYTKERDRVLSIEELRKLDQKFKSLAITYENATNKYGTERPLKKETELAVWICLGTLSRIGELIKARWDNVNLEEKIWFIPAVDTKGEAGKKRAQTVYLSNFVLNKFKQLKELTGDSEWLFPARYKEGHVCEKSASKQVGDRQVAFKSRTKKLKCRVENNSLVVGDVEWTIHDMRRTGATIMQQLKMPRDIINLCQNHVIGSKVDRHYLHYDYSEEKMEAWIKLGNYLNLILNESNVVSFKKA